jgi:hypothetical protein
MFQPEAIRGPDVKDFTSLVGQVVAWNPGVPPSIYTTVPNNRIHPARIRFLSLFVACALAFGTSVPARAQGTPDTLEADLSSQAPSLDANVLGLALQAHDEALERGLLSNPDILSVIDYSRPSVEPRFWVFDLAAHKLLFEELVAHGRNSGDNVATRFSNAESSLESSFGLYVTGDVYQGKHGRSLRLEGLDRGYNDNAEARGIVIHSADYVGTGYAAARGRLGRSWGCPALSPEVASKVIDSIRAGSALFAYYPDSSWIKGSAFLAGAPADPASDSIASGLAAAIAAPAESHGFRARLAQMNETLLAWASVFADRFVPMA